jgi:uncharacterized CHY-type Zn-finger protein
MNETDFTFQMNSSDPDLPVPIVLQIKLFVPTRYPVEHATAKIKRQELTPIFYSLLEKSLNSALSEPSKLDLLGACNNLDKQMLHIYQSTHDADEHENPDENENSDENDIQRIPEESGIATIFPRSRASTHIRLLGLELNGIGVAKCESISLLVQCNKCRETTQIENINGTSENEQISEQAFEKEPFGSRKTECRKCRAVLGMVFLNPLFYTQCPTVGKLQMLNCTPIEVISMTVSPICISCDEESPRLFKTLLPSTSISQNCRKCHVPLRISGSGARFLRIGQGGVTDDFSGQLFANQRATANKIKEEAFIPGQPLPRRGTCKHYGKSYRWFRFPCCLRAYPCDTCHEDQKTDDHEMIRANRMICGFCAKEQLFSEKGCIQCRSDLVAGSSSGFWEGGTGTRSTTLMSRKDGKKHKNSINKTKSKKMERVGTQGAANTAKKKLNLS